MRGVYIVRAQIASLTTSKTLLLGTAPSDMLLEILGIHVTNVNQNTPEQLSIALLRGTTLGSAAGTSISAANVQKAEKGSPNTSATWLSNLTTEPTTYDSNPLHAEGFMNVAGMHHEPPPESRRIIKPSEFFGLKLLVGPSGSITLECEIEYREIG